MESIDIILVIAAGVIIVGGIILAMFLKRRHREQLMREQLPPEYLEILEQHVALYSILPENMKTELHGRIAIFLDEKEFEGCGGWK